MSDTLFHWTFDGHGASGPNLGDINCLYSFLQECPEHLGWKKVMPPYVFRHTGERPEDYGTSGFILIEPGFHISVHTFPAKGDVSIDIFASASFEEEDVLPMIKKYFKTQGHETNRLPRIIS